MAWSVRYDDSLDLVEVVYTGEVSGEELKAAATERIRLQKASGTISVLVDTSGIEHLTAGAAEVFALPGELYDDREAARNTRLALVLPGPPDIRKEAEFYETACVNRGWRVTTFEERADAVEWLKRGARPDRR